jgi:hypothetical protein
MPLLKFRASKSPLGQMFRVPAETFQCPYCLAIVGHLNRSNASEVLPLANQPLIEKPNKTPWINDRISNPVSQFPLAAQDRYRPICIRSRNYGAKADSHVENRIHFSRFDICESPYHREYRRHCRQGVYNVPDV